jgi:hypothetical protein
MSRPLTQSMVALLNKIDAPMIAVAYMVPLRIIRVVATDDTFTTFRVEQLSVVGRDKNNAMGTWTTLSSHRGDHPGEAYQIAYAAATKAQEDLRRKLARRIQQSQQAVRA